MAFVKFAVAAIMAALAYDRFLPKHKSAGSIDVRLDGEYDYIVVGGGSAGSAVAARLSEDPTNKVLLIEAGGDYDESELFQCTRILDFSSGSLIPQKHAAKSMNDNKIFWSRCKVLGGTGILNGMMYSRGSRFDYEEWKQTGCDGWCYRDVLPYFLKSEDNQITQLEGSPFHNTGGLLAVNFGPETEMTAVYKKAGLELGYNITDYNGYDQEGFSDVQMSSRDGQRSCTSTEYISRSRHRKNLHISLRSFATKINIQNKRAIGVYLIRNNKKIYVKVRKEIVVSGGAFNSPKLLMLSGIGPRAHLHALGIPVVVDLPVGNNLIDHPTVFLFNNINTSYSLTAKTQNSWWTYLQYKLFKTGPTSGTGNDGTAFLHIDKQMKGKTFSDVQFEFLSFLIPFNLFNSHDTVASEYLESDPNQHGLTTLIAVNKPTSRGTFRLKSSDPFDYPLIDLNLLSTAHDIEKLIAGIRIWEQLTRTDTYKQIGIRSDQMKLKVCSKHAFSSDSYWECFIRNIGQTHCHPSGTCKMGPDTEPSAVVDLQLRVKGIEGLRVADASVFPTITWGNIQMPVVMIAERVLDFITGKDSVKEFRDKIEQTLSIDRTRPNTHLKAHATFAFNCEIINHNSIYHKVLKTALQINDKTIIDRLSAVANGDLVAVEARYHRRKGCLATYYSYARTGGRTPPKTVFIESDKYSEIYIKAAERLKEECEHSIVVQNKVFYLSTLRERFIQVATDAYKKPSQSPTPVFESSVTLDEINSVEPNAVKCARLKELLYSLGRSSVFCDDLAEDKKLIPLLFASNYTIYATFMSIQILTMNRLPTEVEEGFLAGLFKKTETRKYRGDCSSCRNVDVRGELKVSKDWKMFLSNGQNKERLIQFYS
ncbi:DHGL-like protein [Mya arenaria]|uniref:DHGL-like protein n=1 Tax=Mya arenaria TaxID=6604 RepID=A0ABY7DI96_MYAAR|nr:DHGL-like protein [Mya arenaria]